MKKLSLLSISISFSFSLQDSLNSSANSSDRVREQQVSRFYTELLTIGKSQLSISWGILVIPRALHLSPNYQNTLHYYTCRKDREFVPLPTTIVRSNTQIRNLEQIAVFTKLIPCPTLDHQRVNHTALIRLRIHPLEGKSGFHGHLKRVDFRGCK